MSVFSKLTSGRRLWLETTETDMPTSLEQIEEQAKTLNAEERATLAEAMLASLHEPMPEIESAWAEEVERRVAAFDRGEVTAYPAEDVFAEARRLSW